MERAYPSEDAHGRYRTENMTAPLSANAKSDSPTARPWRGYDVFAMGRTWAAPKSSKYAEYIERNFIPDYRAIDGVHDRLDALDAAGLIHHPKRGKWPGLKRYADADRGKPPQNLFTEPMGFTNYNKPALEYTDWKTQKPLALLERIIKASSNPGDLVLDPFCGCATACIAAEKLNRNWIGIDKVPQAAGVLAERARRELQIPFDGGDKNGWEDWTPFTHTSPPSRTDLTLLHPIDLDEERDALYESQGRKCVGCEYELPPHVLTVDHITPRSKGGLDAVGNIQLLCHWCNATKGNRSMEYLRKQLREKGMLS